MNAPTAAPAAVTLTRAEAYAVAEGLICTADGVLEEDCADRDACHRAIWRLQLEAAIRDAGGWWDDSPSMLDMYEKCGRGPCPESFTITAGGLVAVIELLPTILERHARDRASVEEDMRARTDQSSRGYREDAERLGELDAHREALRGLAARFGVEISQEVTV